MGKPTILPQPQFDCFVIKLTNYGSKVLMKAGVSTLNH